MSIFRKILFARSGGVKVGGGEASEGGAVNIGWACISCAGGGAAIWTFPLTGKGAVAEGYGCKAHNFGGADEGHGGIITEVGGFGIGQGGHDNNVGGVGV